MQHRNIMAISLSRRRASQHHVGEGHAEHINFKGVVNNGTGRLWVYAYRKVSVESRCWYTNVLYPNKWTVVKNRGL